MDYFKSDGYYIYLEAQSAEFYIPKFYFDESVRFADDRGSTINTLGVFDVGIFENGSLKEIKVFNVPMFIDLFVVDLEDKEVELPKEETKTTPCKVLKYQKGHQIMRSSVVEDSSNVEAYLDFVLKGKVPPIIPYEKSLKIWMKNQELNSANLGVPSVIQQLILSVAYRYKSNPGLKFSHAIGKDPNISQYDYVMNNIRQICQYTSTFTAMTFEDLDTMITTSLNRTRGKGNEAYSPLEELLKL